MNIFTTLCTNKYRHYSTLIKYHRYCMLFYYFCSSKSWWKKIILCFLKIVSHLLKLKIFTIRRYGRPRLTSIIIQKRFKKDDNLSTLFVPVPVKPSPDDINVGAELTGRLNKGDLLKILNRFYQKPEIKQLALENGLDSKVKKKKN